VTDAHEARVESLLKAVVLGTRVEDAASRPGGETADAFIQAGALEPPYDPEALCRLFEHSNSLRQNADAYATNIDGFGYRFEPTIDFDAADAREQVAEVLRLERARTPGVPTEPTSDEVDARVDQLRTQARVERSHLEAFFESCCFDHSFVDLRRRTRQDLEVTGNAFWEVLRNARGEVARLIHVPAYTVRLLPLDREFVEVPERVRTSPIAFERITARRRLRRYVQVQGADCVYFKSFGDPRLMLRTTGGPVAPEVVVKAAQAGDFATELIHFSIHSPRSPYGVPRWIGTLLSVLGSRQMEEVNFLYFENKSVPPLALLVSGGRISDASVPRIERYIEENLKGKAAFHRVLILEAEGGGSAGGAGAKIELQPLTDAQQKDALFSEYDQRNIDKIGGAFRLPPLLRGDGRSFNRACHSEDTETLTESGFKHIDQIGPNERIAAFDPILGRIVYHRPAARHVYQVDEELFHFRNRGIDVLVTGEHRMLVRPNGTVNGAWTTRLAKDLALSRFDFRASAERYTWEGQTLPHFALTQIDECRRPRGHDHKPVNAADWLEFVGYFVSDGGLSWTGSNAPYVVYLDQKKPDTLARMRACLDRLGWKYSTQDSGNGCQRMLLSNRCLRDWLAQHCGADTYSRKLPDDYVHLSEHQLVTLFDSLMRGDGHVYRKGGGGVYSSSSRVLADQVMQLCVHLGLRSRVRARRVPNSQHPHFEVFINGRSTIAARREDVRRVPYKGRVYCFELPEHGFFVTRRNGKIAIHGNSADAQLRFAEDQVFQPERDSFDFFVNRVLLADMGIRFWRFRTQTLATRDPERMADMVEKMMRAGVLTPEEGRALAGDVFNREFVKLGDDWTRRPLVLTLAGIQTQTATLAGNAAAPSLLEDAKRLVGLREELRAEEDRVAHQRLELARRYAEPERVTVPREEFESWFAEAEQLAART
jgi:PBSX family phage portal protein